MLNAYSESQSLNYALLKTRYIITHDPAARYDIVQWRNPEVTIRLVAL